MMLLLLLLLIPEPCFAWLSPLYSASGGGVWGSITGTLSNQTDLSNALAPVNAATANNTASTIVKRDASGNFLASQLTLSSALVMPTASYMQFNDATTHNVQVVAPSSMTASYTLTLPTHQAPGPAYLLSNDGTGNLSWSAAGLTQNDLNTARADEIASKTPVSAVSVNNIASLSGNPGLIDGVDFTTGGSVLLVGQTTNTQNGIWTVNPFGAWTRDASMPDNTTSCGGAIVNVIHGGTSYGDTFWLSTCDGTGAVTFRQIDSQLTSGTQPTCDVTRRGLMWLIAGAAGVADTVQVCQKNASNAYVWVTH